MHKLSWNKFLVLVATHAIISLYACVPFKGRCTLLGSTGETLLWNLCPAASQVILLPANQSSNQAAFQKRQQCCSPRSAPGIRIEIRAVLQHNIEHLQSVGQLTPVYTQLSKCTVTHRDYYGRLYWLWYRNPVFWERHFHPWPLNTLNNLLSL